MTYMEKLLEEKALEFERAAAKNPNNAYKVRPSVQRQADAEWLKSNECLT